MSTNNNTTETVVVNTQFAAAFAKAGITAESILETMEAKRIERERAEVEDEKAKIAADRKAAEQNASTLRHEKRMAREAAREEERKAMKVAKELTKARKQTRLMTYYKTVEMAISVAETEIGDVPEINEEHRGFVLSKVRNNKRLVSRGWWMSKSCLAELVPGLATATTIVSIPMVDIDGKRVPIELWQQAFWKACDKYGVPMWTQSSIKSGTFYFVQEGMFWKLASAWDLDKDGRRFSAYAGLLFSEMDGEPTVADIEAIETCQHGEDGNSTVPMSWLECTHQFRAVQINAKGVPVSIAKGIAVPMKNEKTIRLNDSQVKHGQKPGKYVFMTSSAVTSTPVKMYISPEPLMLLKDCPAVRTFLAKRVKEEVAETVSLLTEDRRADFCDRMGWLRVGYDGEMEPSVRAAQEAYRSNTPMCFELESRVSRFALKTITEKVIPSGAIMGWASTMVIDDEHGADLCSREDAKVFAVRVPTTQIAWLSKDPYVKGKGMVVTAKVAKWVSGDADGDRLIVVKEVEVVDLFKAYYNTEIESALKPDKNKNNKAIDPNLMADIAIELVRNSWLVGYLTVAAWKFIQAKMFAEAGLALELANDEPMTYKHDITFQGKPFHAFVSDWLKSNKTLLSGTVNKATGEREGGIVLQWREWQQKAARWQSLREMSKAKIEKPASMFDIMWNAGVSAVHAWDKHNPLAPMSLTRVARLAFAESGTKITGEAWREAREMISTWGEYWAPYIESENFEGEHDAIYKQAEQWARGASTAALCAIMVWQPQNGSSNGFSLKWHTVYAAGRATEVLGWHPEVAARIDEKRGEEARHPELGNLVSALFETVQF